MSKSEDALVRARRALSQVDAELDLDRTRSAALARSRSDAHLVTDDPSVSGVEVLAHGQRPALPRRRATAWALVATVALLGGAGISATMLWQGPGETVPGAPAPASPTPEPGPPTDPPRTGPSVDPSECTPPPPTQSPVPTPQGSDQDSELQPSERCDREPSPSPSIGSATGP